MLEWVLLTALDARQANPVNPTVATTQVVCIATAVQRVRWLRLVRRERVRQERERECTATLTVPLVDGAQVHRLGARWSSTSTSWVVPDGIPLSRFERWLGRR